jgi:LruC domain-containing protein
MKLKAFLPLALLLIFSACISEVEEIQDIQQDQNADAITQLNIPSNFNFETTTDVQIDIDVKGISGLPLSGIKVSFHTDHPDFGGKFLASAFTNSNGKLNTQINVPAYLEDLFIQVHSIGFANQKLEPISNYMSLEFGGLPEEQRPFTNKSLSAPVFISGNYYYMGGFTTGNTQGLPDYLEPVGDNLSQQFLDDVNASLPEGDPVPDANPDYLASNTQLDVSVNDKSDVWVTFVTEGAGFKNSLGYYVFDTNNPPANPSQIDSIFVVLPNASLSGSGGKLNAGDKVKLGTFEAGKTISWVLFRNAWDGDGVDVDEVKFYSRSEFNTMEDVDFRQHTVQLLDIGNQLLLNGFEDKVRSIPNNSDEDFNDLIFYVTANPWEGIDIGGIPQITPSEDEDGDGISDESDDFPNDPTKAIRNTYTGSLAYEDLWPSQGDYDYNDMVIDYEIDHILNGNNLLVDIEADWTIKAVGASFKNGFGVEFDNLSNNAIAGVFGQNLDENIVSINTNGVESNQSNATVIFFENTYNLIQSPGGSFVNTIPSNPYATPVTLNTVISFNTPIEQNDVGFPPYDPFIFVNGDRSREVHLSGQDPTDLADVSLFNTSGDASNPSNNYYYKTENGLPWAINIAEPFDYPIELVPVNDAYFNFAPWATSGGTLNKDWFLDLPGYRDSSKIYE